MYISITFSVTEGDKGTKDIISISVSEIAVSTVIKFYNITEALYESVGSSYFFKAQCQHVHRFRFIFNHMMNEELVK